MPFVPLLPDEVPDQGGLELHPEGGRQGRTRLTLHPWHTYKAIINHPEGGRQGRTRLTVHPWHTHKTIINHPEGGRQGRTRLTLHPWYTHKTNKQIETS